MNEHFDLLIRGGTFVDGTVGRAARPCATRTEVSMTVPIPIISADFHVTDYFRVNVYTTFQDDGVALEAADLTNRNRLRWANDFPHGDSTWPWSQELLAEHQADLRPEQRELTPGGNAADLFRIDPRELMQ
jgi:hypothetical protein